MTCSSLRNGAGEAPWRGALVVHPQRKGPRPRRPIRDHKGDALAAAIADAKASAETAYVRTRIFPNVPPLDGCEIPLVWPLCNGARAGLP
jgi:hypothetical protein